MSVWCDFRCANVSLVYTATVLDWAISCYFVRFVHLALDNRIWQTVIMSQFSESTSALINLKRGCSGKICGPRKNYDL